MAESDSQSDAQERTEEPTPKRREDARKKGQIPRSRELNTTAMLFFGAVAFVMTGGYMIGELGDLLRLGLDVDRAHTRDHWYVVEVTGEALRQALLLLGPFLGIMLATALLAPLALGGWSFSPQALAFKPEKLDPIKGLGRIFAVRGLMELVKSLVKFLLVGSVGAALLWHFEPQLLLLGRESVGAGLAHTGHILSQAFLVLSASLILITAIDVPFQLWDHSRNLKMTRQEVKEEHKNTEGRPEVKSRVRARQREIAQRRMMAEVPKADVVITNPTHFAVALRYDAGSMAAPVVVAKGVELIASHIRTVAVANSVPLFEAPPLARALYYSTEINAPVPAGLYLAVAQVLAYIYQLKTRAYGRSRPERPTDLQVPDDFYQGPEADEAPD
jgi:flagellar biosynthetic protein FlhB